MREQSYIITPAEGGQGLSSGKEQCDRGGGERGNLREPIKKFEKAWMARDEILRAGLININ